jgi:membrane protein required for colicin V production
MSKIDIVLVIILAIGAFVGYRKGFLMELFYLVAILLGVLLGFRLMGVAMEYLQREFNADQAVLPYIAFLVVFMLVVIAVILLGKTVSNLVDKTFLGRVDALAGGLLGAVKYLFCASVLLWLGSSLHLELPASWTEGSFIYPLTTEFAQKISGFLGQLIPFFKETFEKARP